MTTLWLGSDLCRACHLCQLVRGALEPYKNKQERTTHTPGPNTYPIRPFLL